MTSPTTAIRWTKGHPTQPGMYLRATLWARVQRGIQHIHDIDGVLNTQWGGGLVRLDTLHTDFWWYGPIPAPPPEADSVK